MLRETRVTLTWVEINRVELTLSAGEVANLLGVGLPTLRGMAEGTKDYVPPDAVAKRLRLRGDAHVELIGFTIDGVRESNA